MANRIAVSTLQASTINILNVIRQNATLEYQNLVPEVTDVKDIPKVGEVLFGYPAMENIFVNALVNRIALVQVNSATFNNPYEDLKKGLLAYGETVEEIFVGISKVQRFDPEQSVAREYRKTPGDVRSAFHILNVRFQYPITISEEMLRTAFMSESGVNDLIARIVESVYTSNKYDEYLLVKYMLIKAISSGKMTPVSIGDGTDMKDAAKAFRATSNQLTFMSSKYNEAGVFTTTPREEQVIFMDANFDAAFDVDVLASAFNMDKATYLGTRKLIDDFTTFDNDRWAEIRKESDMLEEVTTDELALMANVKAVMTSRKWFQIYDNLRRMTEKYVGSAMQWNYWYNYFATVSHSPFANAVVFATNVPVLPETLEFEIVDKSIAENATVLSLAPANDEPSLVGGNYNFIQTAEATESGIAIHRYGAVMFPGAGSTTLAVNVGGTVYTAASATTNADNVGATITFNKG